MPSSPAIVEQVVGAAGTMGWASRVARAGRVQDGRTSRGLPRRQEQRGHALEKRGDALSTTSVVGADQV